ncbi:site-2 protease family protein [Boudabousia marimammalium]|uniref:Peptidase M50 domain-containing protein n=1 Tax=Boudabousia marimammalium TaxID=156892 RepID=A0A1Q5PJW0_9ACTO|nr:hypothetical protein BM477_07320 [Boudabousia marimammalium]
MFARPTAERIRDHSGELLICSDITVIFDKASGRYFQVPTKKLPAGIRNNAVDVIARFSTVFAWGTVISGILLLITNMVFSFFGQTTDVSHRFPLLFTIYIIASVFIHECAHIFALKICGQTFDKVGFKLHYGILPAFYVRMNKSNLLLWTDKVVVHCAGIWINLAINVVLFVLNYRFWQSADINVSLEFAVVTLMANALPVLSSDGFRVLLALSKVNEFRERTRNPKWIRAIRILSWVIVTIYGIYMVISFYLELGL